MLCLHGFSCSVRVFVEATGLKSQELGLQAGVGARSSARAMRALNH